MNTLIIGGEGYIGNIVVLNLLKNGHSVTTFDNLLYNNHLCVLNKIHFNNYRFIYGDMLFPPTLALACRLKNISAVAVQERMISAWWSWPFLVDHCFVYGPAANQIIEKRFNVIIKKNMRYFYQIK